MTEKITSHGTEYTVTDGSIHVGAIKLHDSVITEINDLPKRLQTKLRGCPNLDERVWYGGKAIYRDVAEIALAQYRQIADAETARFAKLVPGLPELEAITKAWGDYDYKCRTRAERNEQAWPTEPSLTIVAVERKYPAAKAYQTALAYSQAHNDSRATLGRHALESIRAGEDAQEVIVKMRLDWLHYCSIYTR